MDNITYKPNSVAPPGDIVVEYLEAASWTQKDLAKRTGIIPKVISEICNGKAKITSTSALAFEKTLGRPAHFWLNLQSHYEEAIVRQKEREHAADWGQWANNFPLAEMKKRGWIPNTNDINTSDLLTYLGVSSPKSWKDVWSTYAVSYRQTRQFETSDYAISAWLRAVEVSAENIQTLSFNEEKLLSSLNELKACTRLNIQDALDKAESILSDCGVALVIIPALDKTGISGCTRWVSRRKAIIALTLRYKWDDQIWFTLLHEIGHVLLHRKTHSIILDNPQKKLTDAVVDPAMQAIEEEANRFAADILVPPQLLEQFISFNMFESKYIHKFAEAIGVAPGIVVGRLQHEGIIKVQVGNALKQRVDWSYTQNED